MEHHPVQRTELYSLGHPSSFFRSPQAALCWSAHSRFLPPIITGEYEVLDVGQVSFFFFLPGISRQLCFSHFKFIFFKHAF